MSYKNTNKGADCGWEAPGSRPSYEASVAGEEPTVELSPASIQRLSKLALGGYTSTFENDLDAALGKIKELLLAKNKAYGDAALNPLRFHSSASPVEQLNVRMDDKLSRMARGGESDEDEPLDYVGYWVLREIAKLREAGINE